MLNGNIISPNLLRLIKQNKSRLEISRSLSLTNSQMLTDIKTLITSGQLITKNELQTLCVEQNVDFDTLERCINDVNSNLGNVNEVQVQEIQEKYLDSTGIPLSIMFVDLSTAYYVLRAHLDRLNCPCFDRETNSLVKVERLLVDERPETNMHFEPVENPVSYRGRVYGGRQNNLTDIINIMYPAPRNGYEVLDDYYGYDFDDHMDYDDSDEDEDLEEEENSSNESDEEDNDESDNLDDSSNHSEHGAIESQSESGSEESTNEVEHHSDVNNIVVTSEDGNNRVDEEEAGLSSDSDDRTTPPKRQKRQ